MCSSLTHPLIARDLLRAPPHWRKSSRLCRILRGTSGGTCVEAVRCQCDSVRPSIQLVFEAAACDDGRDVGERLVFRARARPCHETNKRTKHGSRLQVGDYADGAVMGVPAHDTRDHAFAVRNNLPIRTVVVDGDGDGDDDGVGVGDNDDAGQPTLRVAPGVVVNSGADFDGLESSDAAEAVSYTHLTLPTIYSV